MDQRSRRKAAVLVNALAIAVCLLAVTGAGAKVIPSITTTLTTDISVPTGSSGAMVTVPVSAVRLGQHSDLTVNMSFSYGATGIVVDAQNGNYEDAATYPAPSSQAESLDHLVVTTPPGLVGNPNAVPYAERCDMSQFETGICPASATVGDFGIRTSVFGYLKEAMEAEPLLPGDGALQISIGLPKNKVGGTTRVSLLKTDPEVPAKIGILVQPPFGFDAIRTVMSVVPDTNGDLRLVTTTPNGISNILGAGPSSTDPVPGTPISNFRIDIMKLRLYGRLRTNGHAFMTNPTSCRSWDSSIWANAHEFNDNADATPLFGDPTAYKAGNTSSITPDCTNGENVPFPIAGSVAISSPGRDTSPAFDFTITNPGVQADSDEVSTSPKKIVTTIPASINVDVQQLGRTCTLANFNADACAKSARVGSVKIETPLISAGLSGDVYLVKRNATSGLPDLGLRVRGAISFTQLGSNRYTGPTSNQIETTFNEIPQVGFSKLTFHLDGGPQGLLRSLSCPTYNKAPAVPNFTYNFTAWTGATATSTTPLNMANCFGIQELKKYPKCLHSILPIHPNYQSRTRVKNAVLSIDGKRKASRKHSPFRFDLPINKLNLKQKAKHTFVLKATYDDKSVSKKTASFRVCR